MNIAKPSTHAASTARLAAIDPLLPARNVDSGKPSTVIGLVIGAITSVASVTRVSPRRLYPIRRERRTMIYAAMT